MNTGLLQSLVDEDFGYREEGREWGRADERSSLVINEEKQLWYWNAEGIGGDTKSYLMKIRGLSRKSAEELLSVRGKMVSGAILKDENDREIRPHEQLVNVLWELGKRNRQYWYTRKLTDKTIDRYRLGFYNGWSLIPLYDGEDFLNFQCRRDEPKKSIRLWYKIPDFRPVMINKELLSLVDVIYITEGPVDSILLNQEGLPSVSHTGGSGYWAEEWFSLFSRIKKIYYIADNDSAGKMGAIKVAKALGLDRTFVYLFDGKPEKYDSGDYFKDGGSAKEFKEMIERDSRNLYELGELDERKTKSRSKVYGRFPQTFKAR